MRKKNNKKNNKSPKAAPRMKGRCKEKEEGKVECVGEEVCRRESRLRLAAPLYYVGVVAALSAVMFAATFHNNIRGVLGGRESRAVELAGTLNVNSLEQQASMGLPYSDPRQQELSMIDVVPARMQQLYDTPSINAAAAGFTNQVLRAAPITDCSGLGCVTRIPGISASPGQLAQPEHILTDLPAAYPALTSQFTVDALLPSVDPLIQRIEDANNAEQNIAKTAIDHMKIRSLDEERELTALERQDDDLRSKTRQETLQTFLQCDSMQNVTRVLTSFNFVQTNDKRTATITCRKGSSRP